MSPSNEEKVIAACPMFYGSLPYFECGDGWSAILIDLGLRLTESLRAGTISAVRALQIKEKFGRLDIYYTPGCDLVDSFVQEAREKAKTVCEDCGKPGALQTRRYWMRVTCSECAPPSLPSAA